MEKHYEKNTTKGIRHEGRRVYVQANLGQAKV